MSTNETLQEPNHIRIDVNPASEPMPVTLTAAAFKTTKDEALWTTIKESTEALSFNNYKKYIDSVMCPENANSDLLDDTRKNLAAGRTTSSSTPFPFVDAYNRLKIGTELFIMMNCGVVPKKVKTFDPTFLHPSDLAKKLSGYLEKIKPPLNLKIKPGASPQPEAQPIQVLPYLALIKAKLGEVPVQDGVAQCYGILQEKLTHPCMIELIWSYWHEEGMLAQAMNAISLRFQNRLICNGKDTLAQLDIDPLRRLSNLLWGYIQDEQHRLTLVRRAYEYDHQYGLTLLGKAVPTLRSADSRSKFLEGFHNLLHVCSIFFERDDDTTVIADGFPVLNALKEVHLLLAQGAHNQYGDLPSTSRMEMLMEMWILSQPEMREFLNSRIMVPYSEPWMDKIDTLKRLQSLTDTTITHFHELAVFGEQLLLSIRYGAWTEIHDRDNASNWARAWRPQIQGYIHNYRTVTGVDLTVDPVDSLIPGVHLEKRLLLQAARGK